MSNTEKHFAHLKKALELEQDEEMETFRQKFSALTPDQREKSGQAILRLCIKEVHYNAAGHQLLTFAYWQKRPLPFFSFEEGDVVSLSRDNIDIFKYPTGTVYQKTDNEITVAFNFLKDEWLDEEGVYHLNRSGSGSTYRKMYEALQAVVQAEHNQLARFRDISMGVKKASEGDPVDWKKMSFFNERLNDWQKQAVAMVLQSPEVALVHGPPGTGKTTVLIEIIRQCAKNENFVFAVAPSNTACDHLLEGLTKAGLNAIRLGHPARIMKDLRKFTLDFQVAAHPLAKEIDWKEKDITRLFQMLDRHRDRRPLSWDEKRDIRDRIHDLKRDVKEIEKKALYDVLNQSQVIVGTLTSARDFVFKDKEIDLLVMDEAAQAIEPAAWISVLDAKKIVLAGDHHQLAPTVKSLDAQAAGLGKTLFERLHEKLTDDFVSLLRVQYRMNEKIMNFSSRQFYECKLIADESVKSHVLADLKNIARNDSTEKALLFLDTAGQGYEEKLEEGSESRYNPEEAQFVIKEVRKLIASGLDPHEIAVIPPYSAQTRYLYKHLKDIDGLEIDTVDGFQGREKEAVLLTLVRSNHEGEMGFLSDASRINVAMTRARRRLFVVGDSTTLSTLPFFQSFIEYAELIGAYQTTWEVVD